MTDLEEERSYSIFERLLFFITPLLFTIILLAVILAAFSPDIRGRMLDVGNQIPLVGKLLPDGPAKAKLAEDTNEESGEKTAAASEQVKNLQSELAVKEAELNRVLGEQSAQEAKILELQSKVNELTQNAENPELTGEQYTAEIKDLASMYTKMAPNKAAPILQNMELPEMVLILNAMRTEDRAKVMEKMTPKIAADATMLMKDSVSVRDQQIAALQARVKRLAGTGGNTANTQANAPASQPAKNQ
ncbi:MotE family protein [Paenibacillus sp. GCM10012307]|uniref:MgtE protein n=1 Tax=Paenibacillus roseus TaxID=2798579 RepID=A0A934JAP7_9BACL|nr:MgtE protein [Paenibacillus roseus]MBJ6363380.1 MgtE protein [Paenibacillus roseus]